MSQRTIGGIENLPNMRDIQENLLNFEFNLKNELEILGACLKLVSQSTLQSIENDVQILKVQINEEMEAYKDFNSQLQRRRGGGLTSLDVEEYNILKLKYNKLILQVEKIYSLNSEMEQITNKFPRSKLRIESQILMSNAAIGLQHHKSSNEETIPKSQNALSRILPKPPLSSNSLISNNSSIIQTLNPGNKNAAQELIKNIAKRETIDENNKEFIKRELIQLKHLIQDVNKKVDTHEHTEYEMELDRLRKENNQIMHDYKILKNDNTELMHSLRTLQKMAYEIKIQNERMLLGLQNPAAFKHYTHSPMSANPPSSNDQREKESTFQMQQQQPPNRLSAISYTNANNKESIQSPNSTKIQNNNNNNNNNNSKRNTILDTNNLLSPQNVNNNQDKQRVLTRNSSHNQGSTANPNNNKCLTEVNQRSSIQRSLIPSQQSNREENADYDLLSSWARKRVMES